MSLAFGAVCISADDSTTDVEQKAANTSTIDVLELSDMDILDVIRVVVKKTGMNIVAGQNVTGKVTIFLKNVDARDALRIILESNGLAYADEDGILRVMTAQDFEQKYGHKFGENIQTKIVPLSFAEASDVVAILSQMKTPSGKVFSEEKSNTVILMDNPSKIVDMMKLVKEVDVQRFTMVFELGYAKAAELSEKVEGMLTKSVGRVKFDERSNKLIVTDTSAKIEEVRKIVNEIDQRDRQVLIEARIAQITLNDEHRMGVDWEAIVSDYHSLSLAGQFSNLSDGEKRGKLSVGTIAGEDYSILVEALDTVGSVDILSNPSITAVNNKEARILVGSTQPYVTTTTTTPSAGPSTTAESVNFIDVGVKLFVTPTVHADGFITMKIRPEVSSVTGSVSTGTNNTIPVVETSEAETTVHVKNGVTIIIGGLIKEEKSEMIKKVPILGDIPFLGMAFRSYSHSVKKTEIVIFLTPKVSTGDVNKEEPSPHPG